MSLFIITNGRAKMPKGRENAGIVRGACETQDGGTEVRGGRNREKSLIRDTAPLVIHSLPIHKKNKGGRDGQGEMRRF